MALNRVRRRRIKPRPALAAANKTGDGSDFEPPKYLSSLIASINDGAKSAQTGALFFLGVGLYLLAVAFSTTDEDLLRERTFVVSQIGVAVPVVFSFAVAPIIFVFLHLHTLIRYDMLAANLKQFDDELGSVTGEQNQERCRHLLANVEFLRGNGAKPGSTLTSRLFHAVSWFMLAGFPLLVLMIIQLSSLRYQDWGIIWAQRAALLADAALLLWFFQRRWWLRQTKTPGRRRARGRLALRCLWVAPLLAFNLAYMGVPSPDATTVGHRVMEDWRIKLKSSLLGGSKELFGPWQYNDNFDVLSAGEEFVSGVWQQPVDFGVCLLNVGCRYLRMPFTLLIAAPADNKVLARLRDDEAAPAKAEIKAIEGMNLRNRTLRFIDLEESRLYAAALKDADMQGAYLFKSSFKGADLRAKLNGAELSFSRLQGADLDYTSLVGAKLVWAYMQRTNLFKANLQTADLSDAQLQSAGLAGAQLQKARLFETFLQGAQLRWAKLQSTYLFKAQMEGADFREASLQGADMNSSELHGADLGNANLQGVSLAFSKLLGANLTAAGLQGTDLIDAKLQGANLSSAQLQGVDLRGAHLWNAILDQNTDLSFADIRGADFATVNTEERAKFLQYLQGIPDDKRRKEAIARVEEALTKESSQSMALPAFAREGPVLIDKVQANKWSSLDPSSMLTDEVAYDSVLAPYLLGLAKSDADVAQGIARRTMIGAEQEKARALYPNLARMLLEAREKDEVKLPDDVAEKLKRIAARATAATAPSASTPPPSEHH